MGQRKGVQRGRVTQAGRDILGEIPWDAVVFSGFFCSEPAAAPGQDSETFLSKSYHWRGQLLMLLSPEIQRLGGIITDKLVMKIWIFLGIMKNFTLVSSNRGGKKNITICFVVEGTVALYDQRMSFFSQPKSAVSICFLTFCCTALLFLASFTVV